MPLFTFIQHTNRTYAKVVECESAEEAAQLARSWNYEDAWLDSERATGPVRVEHTATAAAHDEPHGLSFAQWLRAAGITVEPGELLPWGGSLELAWRANEDPTDWYAEARNGERLNGSKGQHAQSKAAPRV